MNTEQGKEQIIKLKECFELGLSNVTVGGGLIAIHLTENGLRMEIFNCDEDEAQEALNTALDIISTDSDNEVLQ